MRRSRLFGDTKTHIGGGQPPEMLERAGYVHMLSDGLFTLLPLGHRVARRIEAMVRRAFELVGAQELAMPLLQPLDLWQRQLSDQGTREQILGRQLFRIESPQSTPLVLAPTHEEVAALLAGSCIRGPGDLPRTIFQIQPRFRDHPGPLAAGLLRTREFVMADGYSFDRDRTGLHATYSRLRGALHTAVTDCGATTEWADADPGPMGGVYSEELIAPLPNASHVAAWRCRSCRTAASTEIAAFERTRIAGVSKKPLDLCDVPEGLSIGAMAQWLGSSPERRLVWTPFVAAGRVMLGVTTGEVSVNIVKLARELARHGQPTEGLHRAQADELRLLGFDAHRLSLTTADASVTVVADLAVGQRGGFHASSPSRGQALNHLEPGRDFRVDLFADLALPPLGATCSRCSTAMQAVDGIEVAHIFQLGTRFSDAFNARCDGQALEMGCYGIGITRLMAIIAAQRADSSGLVWPPSIAPYLAVVLPVGRGKAASSAATEHYVRLRAEGLDIMLDDVVEPSGERTSFADNLGLPFQIHVGATSTKVHVRRDGSILDVPPAELGNWLRARMGGTAHASAAR